MWNVIIKKGTFYINEDDFITMSCTLHVSFAMFIFLIRQKQAAALCEHYSQLFPASFFTVEVLETDLLVKTAE
jgi:hypothetical protein